MVSKSLKKALHLTAFPIHPKAADELCRSTITMRLSKKQKFSNFSNFGYNSIKHLEKAKIPF